MILVNILKEEYIELSWKGDGMRMELSTTSFIPMY